ncbi:MAG: hypothetical protein L0H26_11250, partial [Microlunatus sp.]|nr:hypothetical protein [Microlunatus sp.]
VDAHTPSETDLEAVRHLVTRHFEETDSAVAKRLLEDWASASGRFTKVLPRDYARVLDARIRAESEGLDEETTTTRMMEAAHG